MTPDDRSATTLLANFISTSHPSHLPPSLRSKIKEVLLDYIGVIFGALSFSSSTTPIYNAILTLQGHPSNTGSCTVLGYGALHMLPQYAGLLNSTFGHSLDFDDTFADGTLHAGVTVVSAAMTMAEVLGEQVTIEDFMLAISVGYEVTCRLGRELGMDAYHRGFHNTSTAGVFGAVAAISSLKRLSADVVEMALGLAGSRAGGLMQYLENGAWNKRLHPGLAVHDAFVCVVLAEAGVIGATRVVEGKYGFLKAFTPSREVSVERLVEGLGREWIWESSALKPFPACRMTHTFIELAGNIHRSRKMRPSDIVAITLSMPPTNMLLIGDPTPNKIHPSNHIDAQFSAYFQVANALLYGPNTGIEAYDKLEDPDIRALCSKTTAVGDDILQVFAGGLKIEWTDGHVDEAELHQPLGEIDHPFTRDKVDQKFLSLTAGSIGPERAHAIIDMIDDLEDHKLEDLLVLLR